MEPITARIGENFAYWRNLPGRVWEYTIGAATRSSRNGSVTGNALFSGVGSRWKKSGPLPEIARRIAAIILMHLALDGNYEAVKKSTYAWPAATTTAETALSTGEQ